jgi:hypothetical protein
LGSNKSLWPSKKPNQQHKSLGPCQERKLDIETFMEAEIKDEPP